MGHGHFKIYLLGVKAVQVLCLVRNIPETHANLERILALLKLDELKCFYSMDLKIVNILLGISVREREIKRKRERENKGEHLNNGFLFCN